MKSAVEVNPMLEQAACRDGHVVTVRLGEDWIAEERGDLHV